jgi:hypothetical protein
MENSLGKNELRFRPTIVMTTEIIYIPTEIFTQFLEIKAKK